MGHIPGAHVRAYGTLIRHAPPRYAINVLPDTFISALQCFVSLRRLEKYLNTPDVENVGTDAELVSLETEVDHSNAIRSVAFVNATVTWPSGDVDDDDDESGMPSPMSGFRTPGGRTPGRKFMLPDLQVEFPVGELTLVCGPLGSGKTLLLLGRCPISSDGDHTCDTV